MCARRKADDLIAGGAVTIDGAVARLGESVDPAAQDIRVNGRRIGAPRPVTTTIVLNKPRGVVTTMADERGRPTVASLLPAQPRLFPVGRLDADSSGVLLCTNDGELANRLAHPSSEVEKVYRVRAVGTITAQTIEALGAANVRRGSDSSAMFDITLHEGKNRQVRRMCAQRGLRVIELTRIRFGPVVLGALAPGKSRTLKTHEKAALAALKVERGARTEKAVHDRAGDPRRHHGGRER